MIKLRTKMMCINTKMICAYILCMAVVTANSSDSHQKRKTTDNAHVMPVTAEQNHDSRIVFHSIRDKKDQQEDDSHPVLYAHYRESHITKQEAEKLKKRLQNKKAVDSTNHKKHKNRAHKEKIYEKRYFDYLPDESESDSIEAQTPTNRKHSPHRHHRRRRNIQPENEAVEHETKNIDKRQSGQILASHYFLQNEKYYQPQTQGYYYPVPSNPLLLPPSRHYLPVANQYPYQVIPSYSYQIFPPNQITHNTGVPPINQKPYKPIQVIPQLPNGIPNRGGFDDFSSSFTDDDGRYVWGARVDDTIYAAVPPAVSAGGKRKPPNIIRTESKGKDGENDDGPVQIPNRPPSVTSQGAQSGRRPGNRHPPSIIRNESKGKDGENDDGPANNRPPPSSPPPRKTVQRPRQPPPVYFPPQQVNTIDTPSQDAGPSKCVWGIVNCCSRNSPEVRYACFEQIGCGGAFWDYNPCSTGIMDAALEETNRYFD